MSTEAKRGLTLATYSSQPFAAENKEPVSPHRCQTHYGQSAAHLAHDRGADFGHRTRRPTALDRQDRLVDHALIGSAS